MTVIAWDGKTLAADKRTSNGSYKRNTTTKIFRWEGGLCGVAGCMETGMHLVDWIQAGGMPEEFPEIQEDLDAEFMVIHNDGRIAYYQRTPVPLMMEDTFHAIGSGSPYALTAMHLGKNAEEAVRIACELDVFCGNGIDVLTLK